MEIPNQVACATRQEKANRNRELPPLAENLPKKGRGNTIVLRRGRLATETDPRRCLTSYIDCLPSGGQRAFNVIKIGALCHSSVRMLVLLTRYIHHENAQDDRQIQGVTWDVGRGEISSTTGNSLSRYTSSSQNSAAASGIITNPATSWLNPCAASLETH